MQQKKQRIVVKIGSSSLTKKDGSLSPVKLAQFCDAFAETRQAGHELIVVSSGSVAAGFREIGYPVRPVTVQAKQAAAAVGQSLLMQQYRFMLQQYGITAAQLLLTRHDFRDGEHYQNISAALSELLKRHVLPIINENDSTAVDELTFGDNDMLSALISGATHADKLILFTDADGVYTANPQKDPAAEKFRHIAVISDDITGAADTETTAVGTGGMRAKLKAAEAAQEVGVGVYIGRFAPDTSIASIAAGIGSGTYIQAGAAAMKTRKQWIAYHASPRGMLRVDPGAAEALLQSGKSLLSVGVIEAAGDFDTGDVIDVYDEEDHFLGKGKAAAPRTRLQEDDASFLIIHRDEWVAMNNR
ncbi:glutamate 5-kinase [Alkalicoccus chagannorensis]|uniref:glutamate 5-kinase n=1 Tax=Alkalicoccus chagannorensis TaxID=427072 RepID=UPI0004067AA2|nr:glutamate 5-kinase [Alkalicoccus chagannorensis]